MRVLTNGRSWFGACLDACWVRVSREREVEREGSREGKVKKWIEEREREEVDRVGEMMVIENDVFHLYCY